MLGKSTGKFAEHQVRVDELVDVVEVQKVVHEERLVHGVVEEEVRQF